MIFLLTALLWSRPYVPVQMAELPPAQRVFEATRCIFQGKNGEAITHLLLLVERHPQHPLTPWARLAVAVLYEYQGDFIAARVWYDRASMDFPTPVSQQLTARAHRLDTEIQRLPVQVMREGRYLLKAPLNDHIERAQRAFLVRFPSSPLHAELKWRLAAFSLQKGNHVDAFFFLLWSVVDGHPETQMHVLPLLRAWPTPLWPPYADGLAFLWLVLWLMAVGVRFWQGGVAGPGMALVAAFVSLFAFVWVPSSALFWPLWLFLTSLRLWVVGVPVLPLRFAVGQWARWLFFLLWSLVYCLHVAGVLHR